MSLILQQIAQRCRGEVTGGGGVVTPFFADNLAGGALNPANGFTWGGLTADPGNSLIITSEDAPPGATHSLKFTYRATVAPANAYNCELRFDMGRYLNEVWIEYQWKPPATYSHRANAGDNNKFFALWRDDYSDTVGGTQQFTLETWPYEGAPGAKSMFRASARAGLITDIDPNTRDYPQLRPPFINPGPIRLGEWNRIRFHMRGSSSFGVSDGLFEVWVNDVKFLMFTEVPLYNTYASPADVLYRNGYFMGYCNSGYDIDTSFYLSDFKFYDSDPGWDDNGAIYAIWENEVNAGMFNEGLSATYPLVGGENIARFDISGVNTGQSRMYFPVPSRYMTNGRVLHIAYEIRLPQSTLDILATNLGFPPYPQIKFHLSRAEDGPAKWAGQTYRFAVNAMGVSSDASAPNSIVVRNDWFNIAYDPHKISSALTADTWLKVQLSYRDDGSNAYVRAWFNKVEVGSESVSNDNTGDGGSNNNGGSEGLALMYHMSFGIEFAQLPGSQTDALRVEIRRIKISDHYLSEF